MATCPSGHESASDDFCDVCGIMIGVTAGPGRDPAPASPSLGGVPAEKCPRCGVLRVDPFCEACGYNFTFAGSREPLPAAAAEPMAARVESAAVPPVTPEPVTPEPVTPEPVTPEPSTPEPRSAEAGLVQPGPVQPSPRAGAGWTAVVTAARAYYDSIRATGGPDAGAIAFPDYCPERRFPLAGAEVRVGRRSARSGIDPEIDLTGPPADPGVSRLHAVLIKATDGSWSVVDPGSANGTLVNDTEIARDQIVPLRDGDRIHLGAWTELEIVRER